MKENTRAFLRSSEFRSYLFANAGKVEPGVGGVEGGMLYG
jgi:hypothetical protein